MRLEGTLDAFSLPDIFQLLSFTKKTGTLHLRRDAAHGAVHVRDGAVTGARADVARQELARRLLGSGLVDDETLASAAEQLADDPSLGLGRLLAERAGLGDDTVREVAAEQVTDAVFSLLRWEDGEFAFVVDEADPDDLGAALPVEQVVTEGQRRLAAWTALVDQVPGPESVVVVNPAPPGEVVASRDEWALLSLVDGRRTVADLVRLSGRGEYATVSALAGLVGREVLVAGSGDGDRLARRQSLLAALEGAPVEEVPEEPPAAAAPAAPPSPAVPAQAAVRAPVIPERPEPFTPARRPDHAEEVPSFARASAAPSGAPAPRAAVTTAGSAHPVEGATALAPATETAPDPAVASLVERDPSINKSLLLRLIAGVRGL